MKGIRFGIVLFLLNINLIMAQGYETQSYEVIQNFEEGEIRFYPQVMMAKTSSQSDLRIENCHDNACAHE